MPPDAVVLPTSPRPKHRRGRDFGVLFDRAGGPTRFPVIAAPVWPHWLLRPEILEALQLLLAPLGTPHPGSPLPGSVTSVGNHLLMATAPSNRSSLRSSSTSPVRGRRDVPPPLLRLPSRPRPHHARQRAQRQGTVSPPKPLNVPSMRCCFRCRFRARSLFQRRCGLPRRSVRPGRRLCNAGKTLAANRVAESNKPIEEGHRSAAHWLAGVSGESVGEAMDVLRLGQALEDQPGVDDAYRHGELSRARAKLVSGAVKVNPQSEGEILQGAKHDSLRQLKERCLRAKAQGRSGRRGGGGLRGDPKIPLLPDMDRSRWRLSS